MKEPMKNIAKGEALILKEQVDYQPGQVVSKTLAQNDAVSVTLFSFDKGEEISTHQSEGDAFVTCWTAWAASPSTARTPSFRRASLSSCPPVTPTRCLARSSSRCCWWWCSDGVSRSIHRKEGPLGTAAPL